MLQFHDYVLVTNATPAAGFYLAKGQRCFDELSMLFYALACKVSAHLAIADSGAQALVCRKLCI
jgi:hypothetical protein